MTDPTRPPASAMPFVGGLVLLVATGFVDAYTFLAHGHVFAEAQTGNLVLAGVGLVDSSIVPFWRPLVTFASFLVGVAVAWMLGRSTVARAPQLATLGFEVVVLTVVGFLPSSFPDAVVTCAIAFAAGLQIAAFNRIGAARFTTVVMTSNSLAAVDASLRALASRTATDARAASRLLAALTAFVTGAVVGALLTDAVGGRAAWFAAGLFLVAGVAYLARQPGPERPVSSRRPFGG